MKQNRMIWRHSSWLTPGNKKEGIQINSLTIIGNLTADPETRTTKDGKSVCGFTVAVNRRGQKDANGNNIADFFRVGVFGKTGEACQKYLGKGKKVCVVGSVSVHAFTGNDGQPRGSLEVFATDVEFLASAGDQGSQQAAPAPVAQPVDTDTLPF